MDNDFTNNSDFVTGNFNNKPVLEIRGVDTESDYKSRLVVGNITVRFTKKFNWFNRLMIRLVFGLKIEKEED